MFLRIHCPNIDRCFIRSIKYIIIIVVMIIVITVAVLAVAAAVSLNIIIVMYSRLFCVHQTILTTLKDILVYLRASVRYQ